MPRLAGEKKSSAQPSYTWAMVRSECSASCGGGRSLLLSVPVVGTEVSGAQLGCDMHYTGSHYVLMSKAGCL